MAVVEWKREASICDPIQIGKACWIGNLFLVAALEAGPLIPSREGRTPNALNDEETEDKNAAGRCQHRTR